MDCSPNAIIPTYSIGDLSNFSLKDNTDNQAVETEEIEIVVSNVAKAIQLSNNPEELDRIPPKDLLRIVDLKVSYLEEQGQNELIENLSVIKKTFPQLFIWRVKAAITAIQSLNNGENLHHSQKISNHIINKTIEVCEDILADAKLTDLSVNKKMKIQTLESELDNLYKKMNKLFRVTSSDLRVICSDPIEPQNLKDETTVETQEVANIKKKKRTRNNRNKAKNPLDLTVSGFNSDPSQNAFKTSNKTQETFKKLIPSNETIIKDDGDTYESYVDVIRDLTSWQNDGEMLAQILQSRLMINRSDIKQHIDSILAKNFLVLDLGEYENVTQANINYLFKKAPNIKHLILPTKQKSRLSLPTEAASLQTLIGQVDQIPSEMPNLAYLVLKNTPIKVLPNAPGLDFLQLEECKNIRAIPEYQSLRQLFCSHLPISDLPKLPKLEKLNLENCPIKEIRDQYKQLTLLRCMKLEISVIPIFPLLNTLILKYLPNLKEVPCCESVKELILTNLNDLEKIPYQWPNVINLLISNVNLRELPRFENVKKVFLQNLDIKRIDKWKNVKKITLNDLNNISILPKYETLIELEVDNLSRLKIVPDLANLEILYLKNLRITEIQGKLAKLKKLTLTLCTHLSKFPDNLLSVPLTDIDVNTSKRIKSLSHTSNLKKSKNSELDEWIETVEDAMKCQIELSKYIDNCDELFSNIKTYNFTIAFLSHLKIVTQEDIDLLFETCPTVVSLCLPKEQKIPLKLPESAARLQTLIGQVEKTPNQMNKLEYMALQNSPIEMLPEAPKLKILRLNSCQFLKILPKYENLKDIDLEILPELEMIPHLPNVISMLLRELPIQSIPANLKSLKALYVAQCPQIKELPKGLIRVQTFGSDRPFVIPKDMGSNCPDPLKIVGLVKSA